MASVQISFDLGVLRLDAETEHLERTACADPTGEACAVLSAIADIPFVAASGPTTVPNLPQTFAAVVDVPSQHRIVDVDDWYQSLFQMRVDQAVEACGDVVEADDDADAAKRGDSTERDAPGCGLGLSRSVGLEAFALHGVDPMVLAEAQLERALLVRKGSQELGFPAFEMALVQDSSDVDANGGDGEFLFARSEDFDDDGVAWVEFSDGALDTLAVALSERRGSLRVGPVAGSTPNLVATPEGTLRRPSGDAALTFVLEVSVPVSMLLDETL